MCVWSCSTPCIWIGASIFVINWKELDNKTEFFHPWGRENFPVNTWCLSWPVCIAHWLLMLIFGGVLTMILVKYPYLLLLLKPILDYFLYNFYFCARMIQKINSHSTPCIWIGASIFVINWKELDNKTEFCSSLVLENFPVNTWMLFILTSLHCSLIVNADIWRCFDYDTS